MMCKSTTQATKNNRRGVVLIVVLVLIVMISLGVYSFAQLMTAQESGTVMAGRRLQAQAAVAAGVEYVKDYLILPADGRVEAGGHWNNPSYFQDVVVGDESEGSTRFSVISIEEDQYGEPIEIRYGLTDEGSKLNVNSLVSDAYGSSEPAEESLSAEPDSEDDADEDLFLPDPARDALMGLPNMTESIADSILDWIDTDDEPREFGAEIDAYSFLGYEPRNGPINSLDELLLVQGVTTELLYGSDRNHNGLIDANEQTGTVGLADSASGASRGWSALLTTRSQDIVEQAEEPVDLNQDDLETLYNEIVAAGFEEDFASFVIIYRQNGVYKLEVPDEAPDDFVAPQPRPVSSVELDFDKGGDTKIQSVLDLLGSMSQAEFEVPGKEEPEMAPVESPYTDGGQLGNVLPDMMSLLAAGEVGGSSGLNTNQCSSATLSGVPNLEPDLVQGILQLQDRAGSSGDLNYNYPTWPLGLGAVSIEQMRDMLPYVAGQGTVFRAQIVGYSDVPGVFARAEVVIDASGEEPRVLSWRDLSHLGLGFPLETLTQ